MTCVILQPSYIPWRGYFHLIQKADVFVFYDDVQYDKHGWRNRNRIKTPHGSRWLTVPVSDRANVSEHRLIKDIEIASPKWASDHWMTLRHTYGKAPFFKQHAEAVERSYAQPWRLLADMTVQTTIDIARMLGITHTRFVRSSALSASGTKTERLIHVLKAVGATHYISGPSARDYLDEAMLRDAGVSLEWMVYNYPEYPQLYPPYDPQVTVLDLLFTVGGERAGEYIWGADGRGIR
jgi:hypothetical protein